MLSPANTSGNQPSGEVHRVNCPHCGDEEILNDGTGIYTCPDCGEDIEITLTCPGCGEELEVEEWSETECPECGTSFDSWKEADLTPADEEVDAEEREAECPHCGTDETVNDGTGIYECPDCGGDIEISLACPHCGEELEVEEWGENECPACGASFDSWEEAEVTSASESGGSEGENSHRNDPQILGKYALQKLLGEGAFGRAWKAVDLVTGQTVALKIYRNAAYAFEQLKREVEMLRPVAHPHLVRYLDCNVINSTWYLAMDFCDGGSLADQIGKVDKANAIRYIHQILDGVAYLHQLNFLHRDLKPDNVFLHQGHVKVGDLGVTIESNATLVGAPSGTPIYMAPEQLTMGRTSRRSDVWAIGVVAYELLHGRRPFACPEEIIAGRDARITISDRRLAAVLARALQRSEKRRFQTCGEFKAALGTPE